jgi:ADP-ribosyl-[dinitrogen reductase] hydrolase
MKKSIAKEILFGTAVGDALGVPVEFKSRENLAQKPVTDMIGYGTHNQPAGTWSDDSSLAFCLADSLNEGYSLKDIANKFIQWFEDGLWTPHGEVFDIGITTRNAIQNLKNGVEPMMAGEVGENSNGNGSLMRILPLLPHVMHSDDSETYSCIKEVSSLTHRHPRSILACIILIEYARILTVESPKEGLWTISHRLSNYLIDYPDLQNELVHFHRLYDGMSFEEYSIAKKEKNKSLNFFDTLLPSLATANVNDIKSTGYVVDSLEASIWCLVNSTSFEEAILKAVNLGGDTDTIGAITGGLAAIAYGYDSIPKRWIEKLARVEDIESLAERLDKYYVSRFLTHNCPICGTDLRVESRYPKYLCHDCANKATDVDGRKLDFFNLNISGSYGAVYCDTNEDYLSHDCYVEGVKCRADEARFGGIVIEKNVE